MTLYRQLVIFTLVLFFILFTGTWLAKLESTRSFLIDQLESHSQDTATSLGLSISQHNIENDMPAIEGMINAVFDRGYYRIVRYTDTNGNILIDRVLNVSIENVPQWFISFVPLKTPEATANVMAGWHQAGMVYVKSHPGYAYKTLWENVVRMSLWFLACGIVVLIAGGYGLRVLLKPLVMVERQADALCKKKYEIQDRLPKTKELRRVVEAMNRMTSKVKEMFQEQVTIAEGLRKHAYHDSITGLGNRRYFDTQITARLDRRDSTTKGIVLLVQINDLQGLNQQKGFQAGDELLQRVGAMLKETTKEYPNSVLARLTGGDFGIFVPDVAQWDAESIAEAVGNNLNQLAVEQLTLTDNVGHVGAVSYESTTTLKRLLSEADLALRSAQQAGPNKWEVHIVTEEMEKTPLGEQQWKETLDRALSERLITLFAQPVVNTFDRNQIIHLEIFSRIIQDDGSLMSAGVFMPFAERLQLVSYLDRIVIEDVMQIDSAVLNADRVAVNVSPASLQNDSFRRWLLFAVENLPEKAPRINFEFPEFGAVQHLEMIKEFSSVVRKYEHLVGLDHYGQSFSHLGYLKSLRPDYVKIDRAYTGELKDKESDSRFFIGSLCSVAHSLDITVIAEGVETEEQWQQLKELNLDAIQGYIVERPMPLLGEKQ
ncbi:MAG: EAL domain-containing protein [Deltaproteobacteria bacterium]|nr:MAG: EAL domain-containing protein [Deltaproteobacteria bacterium]